MASASSSDAEQRRHQRYLGIEAGKLRLAVRPEFRGRAAKLIDISAGGIGFLVKDALAVGTVLAFELQTADGIEATARLARVRHCRPHPIPADAPWLPPAPALSKFFRGLLGIESPTPEGHAWLIGCAFDQPLSEDEVKQLLLQLKSPR